MHCEVLFVIVTIMEVIDISSEQTYLTAIASSFAVSITVTANVISAVRYAVGVAP